MVGIWSSAFTRRQLWGGGRESRSGEWELCSSLPATAIMTHPHAYTLMHNTLSYQTHMSHTHTGKIIKGGLQQLKATAGNQGLWPWLQEAKTGDEWRGLEGGREAEREKEREGERTGEWNGDMRGVPEHDCAIVHYIATLTKDYSQHYSHNVKTQSWNYSNTTYKLYLNMYGYIWVVLKPWTTNVSNQAPNHS